MISDCMIIFMVPHCKVRMISILSILFYFFFGITVSLYVYECMYLYVLMDTLKSQQTVVHGPNLAGLFS